MSNSMNVEVFPIVVIFTEFWLVAVHRILEYRTDRPTETAVNNYNPMLRKKPQKSEDLVYTTAKVLTFAQYMKS